MNQPRIADPATIPPAETPTVMAHIETAIQAAAYNLAGCAGADDVLDRVSAELADMRGDGVALAQGVWAWLIASALAVTFALATLDAIEVAP